MKDTFIPAQNLRATKWCVLNAKNKTLGRLATEISKILTGKKKSTYTPFISTGDCVIVLNAEKIIMSANKDKQKIYRNHSGRPGGMRIKTFLEIQQDSPKKIVFNAIKGMLPKSAFGRAIYKNLKVYKGNYHNHISQVPKLVNL
jgi:large subunit ribosomal protein L13